MRLLDLWPTLGRTEGRASCAEAAIAGVADGNGDGAAERGVTRNGGCKLVSRVDELRFLDIIITKVLTKRA